MSVEAHPLTESQLRDFERDGYLHVTGLIPDEVSRDGADVLERVARGGTEINFVAVEPDPALSRCYTPQVLAAAARLAQEPPDTFHAPSSGYALIVLPEPGPWKWPQPHLDHAIKKYEYPIFPRPFRIASMAYLSDVASHGGATVVWPGSARRLREAAEREPERFRLMWQINEELSNRDLEEPVEITARRGDVLFYDYLCAHSGSMNVSDRPRLAMNMKW
jgi:hypothetical protein